jgi:hypothetical protein
MSNARRRGLVPSRVAAACTLLAPLLAAGCSSRDVGVSSEPFERGDGGGSADASPAGTGSCAPDESAPVPADRCTTDPNDTSLPRCNAWIKVEPPGAVCSDGSQYKFFVSYSNTSNDVVMEFEPGGACWDYESCSGNGGIRGAANPHGIPDNHMATFGLLPLMDSNPKDPASNPVKEYNKIFVSYCTGDIHTGNTVAMYTSTGAVDGGTGPNGTDTITFRHAGHANTLAVVDWMKSTFKTVPKLLVTGCSAGGAGALLNYAFIRLGMGKAVQCGYLLDDSGPIFHSDGPSKALHERVRSAWNTDPLLDELKQQIPIDVKALKTDLGLINTSLASLWKKDRFALTAYRMDFNYSLYSYQRFFPNPTEAEIHQYWWEDLQALMKTYDSLPNMSYFLPFFRSDNCSHCDTIPPIGNPPPEPLDLAKVVDTPWAGTEIQKEGVNVRDFVVTLLDDKKPLESHVEEVQPNESFSPEVSALCMEGAGSIPGQ